MAAYALAMVAIAGVLNRSGQRPAVDLILKFAEDFASIRRAMETQGLWDDTDGLFYDRLVTSDGTATAVKVRSMVGVIPVLAAGAPRRGPARSEPDDRQGAPRLLRSRGLTDPDKLRETGLMQGGPGDRRLLLGVVGADRLERILATLFDEGEFLSPYGLRAISAHHRDNPYQLDVEGLRASIDYEPAESTTSMFGGNSNWRGPLWFPLELPGDRCPGALRPLLRRQLPDLLPTGSDRQLTLGEIAQDLRRRMISIFLVGPDGRRPCFGWTERFQQDPRWKDCLLFNEYFHGDNGAGLGASHQTGWTGVVADAIRRSTVPWSPSVTCCEGT